ncbi:hypothetical protein NW801_13505 [Brevibacillus laterosporus]|uniref:Uncharacterized protein n=1 Tax=Brevibacillus halotolerans TaxID=1507437 RepID=A0ABT4HYG8_9BACL|nr:MULTISPECIES: hypothetical protein [Brevibacillus]MCR8986039.1 hypothetical protein [Brevibacillus laterosporus]MCZ0831772.1 hypothetical protein [Brevibacillus halotolerans]
MIVFLRKIVLLLKVLLLLICFLAALFLVVISFSAFTQDDPAIFIGTLSLLSGAVFGFIAYKCLPKPFEKHGESNREVTAFISEQEFPTEVIDSMQTNYDVANITNVLRVAQDCKHLVLTSRNIDTVFSRLELGAQKALTLKQLETSGLYDRFPTADELLNVFINQKPKIVNRCLQASYEDVLLKFNQLKTSKSKINLLEKFILKLHEHDDFYDFENEEHVERIENELRTMLSKLAN